MFLSAIGFKFMKFQIKKRRAGDGDGDRDGGELLLLRLELSDLFKKRLILCF